MAAYISFQPIDFFNTKLYTGDGGTTQAQTGVGFAPDMVWVKCRDANESHVLGDSAKGGNKYVIPDTAAAQGTLTTYLKSFDADGFTVGQGGFTGSSSLLYVGWNWKGGTTSGITTDGSTTITPSAYSFSQTAGFSALEFAGNSTSGAKLAHGLGATPEFVLVKSQGSANNWSCYHKDMETTNPWDWTIQLDTDAAAQNAAGFWNDTAPDSVNLTLGNDNGVNGGYDYSAYCFTGKKGASKFGYYYGNGNADGPFINTGFRPAYVLIKRNHATGYWVIYDNKRLGYNGGNSYLEANEATQDDANDQIDFLANGIKIRNTGSYTNTSLSTYIYAAFAEFPFVSSNSKATVAR
jgi:hypothetical protein